MVTTANKIQLVSNRVDRAKSFLLAQFKDKPNTLAIVEALVQEIQEFENGVIALQEARTLNGSFGVWLDEIGKRNGVSRGSYNDNDYKNAIKLAMSRRYSSGQVDNILRIVELLTNDNECYMQNKYQYELELVGYFFCLADSEEGLEALAAMFPLNTYIRFVRRDGKQFQYGVTGAGYGSGATLGDLIYTKAGASTDPRFTTVKQQIIPPPVFSGVVNVTPPVLSGSNLIGGTLVTSNGVWTGDDPITYSYTWYQSGVVIGGATTNSLLVTSGMAGKTLLCVVTASNGFSSASVSSNAVAVENIPIVVNPLLNNLGLRPIDKVVVAAPISPIVMSAGVSFMPDGTISFDDDTGGTSNWIATQSGIGTQYKVSYIRITGPLLNIPPETEIDIASATFTLANSVPRYQQVYGEYLFTIRKISDASILKTGTLTISLENDL